MNYGVKYLKYSANILSWIIGLLLLIFVVPRVIGIAIPFILGWIIAWIANPLVRFLESKIKIRRKIGSVIIILLVLTLLTLALYFSISKLVSEAVGFAAQLPSMSKNITSDFLVIQDNLRALLNNLPLDIQDSIFTFGDRIFDYAARFIENAGAPTIEAAGNLAKNIPPILIAVIITILSSYFMLSEKEEITRFVSKQFSPQSKANFAKYSTGAHDIVGGYFKAQIKIMGFVWVVLFVGLLILKVRFGLLFSVLIALLDFLPFFGTGTVLWPWALFQLLSGDYSMAIGLMIIYGVSQGLRHVIQPKILGDTIGMNPLLTMILMYVGYRLFGVWGLIFAAPIGMLIINLNKQGVFDNPKFIISDIRKDLIQLKNIDRYKNQSK